MRCLKHCALAALLTLSAPMARAAGNIVGTVAIVEGNAYVQEGEIYYTRPRVGEQVQVNTFGQYKDSKPIPAFVKWTQNTRRHLKPNDVIHEGEVLQTMGNGWIRVFFKDDSIVDIGPAGMLQVKNFVDNGKERKILFKMLYGKVRTVVAKPLVGPQQYQLLTPSILLGVRGTEFLVHVFPGKDGLTHSEVLCLHGQVSVDTARHTDKGIIYHLPVVVNPGSFFTTQGVHGLAQNTKLRSVSQKEMRELVAKISPQVNVFGTAVGSSPSATMLTGTGVPLKQYYQPRRIPAPDRAVASVFDSEHPPMTRQIASPSGNFELPRPFALAPGAFGSVRDHSKETGPLPISQLPATTSRVRLSLGNLQ